MIDMPFVDDFNLIPIVEKGHIVVALATYPNYIYTVGSFWNLYEDQSLWRLVNFYPSLKEQTPNEDAVRVLIFRL